MGGRKERGRREKRKGRNVQLMCPPQGQILSAPLHTFARI